jgi:hypothetical protein
MVRARVKILGMLIDFSRHWSAIYVQSDAGMGQAIVDAVKERKKVLELVKDADIFVENLRPHLAAQQGYGAEDLALVRPGIIYVRIKLNNVIGPWADWVGFDFNAGDPTAPTRGLKIRVRTYETDY